MYPLVQNCSKKVMKNFTCEVNFHCEFEGIFYCHWPNYQYNRVFCSVGISLLKAVGNFEAECGKFVSVGRDCKPCWSAVKSPSFLQERTFLKCLQMNWGWKQRHLHSNNGELARTERSTRPPRPAGAEGSGPRKGRGRAALAAPARASARGRGEPPRDAGSAPRPTRGSGVGAAGGLGGRFPAPGSLRPSRPLPWPGRPRLAGAGPVTSPIHTAAQLAPPGRSPRQRGRRSAGNDFQLPARGSAPAPPRVPALHIPFPCNPLPPPATAGILPCAVGNAPGVRGLANLVWSKRIPHYIYIIYTITDFADLYRVLPRCFSFFSHTAGENRFLQPLPCGLLLRLFVLMLLSARLKLCDTLFEVVREGLHGNGIRDCHVLSTSGNCFLFSCPSVKHFFYPGIVVQYTKILIQSVLNA